MQFPNVKPCIESDIKKGEFNVKCDKCGNEGCSTHFRLPSPHSDQLRCGYCGNNINEQIKNK